MTTAGPEWDARGHAGTVPWPMPSRTAMNRTALLAVALAAVLVSPMALPGQDPPPPAPAVEPVVDPATVALMIRRLGDADPAKADAAMVALIRGGAPSLPVLRAVLAQSRDPGVRARAERALPICEVTAPAENGLKTGLTADRTTLALGETVTLTTTLCNVGDRPIAIYLGMSYSGNVLENGLAVQALAPDGAAEPARMAPVGFCGTGAKPIVVPLQPYTSQRFTLTATLRPKGDPDDMVSHDGPHLRLGHFVFLPVARDARIRLQLRHAVVPKDMVDIGKPDVPPDWQGTIQSNAVELRLR